MSMTSLETPMNADWPRSAMVRDDKLPAVRRASLLSLMFAVLLGTGVYIEFLASWNWKAGEAVLLLHIVLGLVFAAMFLFWIGAHLRLGLPKSQRPLFTWLSWMLLAGYALVLVTGVVMVIPSAMFFAGWSWFWRFETTHLLTLVHLWAALAAAAGLVAHLYLRHWHKPASVKGGASS
jgi:hypothetical protein